MERCTGRDPSPLELPERSSNKEIGTAHRFIDEEEEPRKNYQLRHFH